ncbi:glycoside hydrolase [Schizothecium vesticola]|uniref:lytic cellulose monooxygenase (C4-dehydrogenating) n=1 Tax=Schizothecium vesticola TaxID=314040 RepID=A0AA40K4H6_9PEZI|nr:glycoside hydrolase [Schizothecium vesticola]
MGALFVALLGCSLLPGAFGHNVFGILMVNGTAAPEWTYVLDVESERPRDEWSYQEWDQSYKIPPIIGVDNPAVTCGRRAFEAANRTQTADVLAGSEVGFRVSTDGYGTRDSVYYYPPVDYMKFPRVWHAGPALVYLSRAPGDDLQKYQGDGDWFKIAYAGPLSNTEWQMWPDVSDFNFTVPLTTPPGKYLMRIENIFPETNPGYRQFYVNCALVNIIGPGGGVPKGFAKFPGTYKEEDPGLQAPRNQVSLSGIPREELRLLEYKPPGPAVWTG